MKRLHVSLAVGIIAMALCAPVHAIPEGSNEFTATAANRRVNGSLRKLGRGVANIVTSPLEMIRVPELMNRREGFIASSTIGVAQGVWHMVRRAVVGVFEVGTFFIEEPKGFGPIISPEYVHSAGDWNR